MRGKFNNVHCTWNGKKYPSKKQRDRAIVLHDLLKRGEISNLVEEKTYSITVEGIVVAKVRLDFVYNKKNGELVYEDVKGFFTPVQRLKYKIFAINYGKKILLT